MGTRPRRRVSLVLTEVCRGGPADAASFPARTAPSRAESRYVLPACPLCPARDPAVYAPCCHHADGQPSDVPPCWEKHRRHSRLPAPTGHLPYTRGPARRDPMDTICPCFTATHGESHFGRDGNPPIPFKRQAGLGLSNLEIRARCKSSLAKENFGKVVNSLLNRRMSMTIAGLAWRCMS